jgi:hypothetical protein
MRAWSRGGARGGSVPAGGGHAGGQGGQVVHRESFLGVKRRGGGPKEGHRRWGGGAQWCRLLRLEKDRAAVQLRSGENRGGDVDPEAMVGAA